VEGALALFISMQDGNAILHGMQRQTRKALHVESIKEGLEIAFGRAILILKSARR
jgi:hypothetical protein